MKSKPNTRIETPALRKLREQSETFTRNAKTPIEQRAARAVAQTYVQMKDAAPQPYAQTPVDRTKTILAACAKQSRETIQTVKPSLNDREAFALYVLAEHAQGRLNQSTIERLQTDFHVRVTSDAIIHSI